VVRGPIILLLTFLPAAASAQVPFEGYVIGGLGQWVHNTGSSGPLVVGAAGIEWRPLTAVGIAGEGGVFTSSSGGVLFSLGVDARLHFRGTAAGMWKPYVLAGYSPLNFFGLTDHGVQFGGGADYRLRGGRAIRLEVRDVLRRSAAISSHYWTARVGVTFR
jgi:hypothetical protein